MTAALKLDADTVRVGEAVTGSLSGDTDAETVELLWRVEGECETDERVVDTVGVDAGQGFRLTVPAAGPMSYSGQLFTVSWHVRAADTETTFTVCASSPHRSPP